MYVNGTLRSWIHYIELRGANGTQKEHIDIVHAVADVTPKYFHLQKNLKEKKYERFFISHNRRILLCNLFYTILS